MPGREGQLIGDYRLLSLLGSGTFGEVYLSEHLETGERVALKLLKLTDEDMTAFVREARIAFRLRHPHIVQLLDFGSVEKIPYLVTNYVPGGTLRHRHPRGTRLPLDQIASYLKPLADALQYAHDQRVIHRDIKPENVLIGHQGELVLSDFGIALTTPIARSLSTQDLGGTAPYMAPEQIRGKPLPASDQYALGIMVYEWLCGIRPFQGNFFEMLDQHRSSPPPSIRNMRPDLPAQIEEVLFRALAKDPAQRFTRVQDFALALLHAMPTSVLPFSAPDAPAEQPPTLPFPAPAQPGARPFAPIVDLQPSSRPAPVPLAPSDPLFPPPRPITPPAGQLSPSDGGGIPLPTPNSAVTPLPDSPPIHVEGASRPGPDRLPPGQLPLPHRYTRHSKRRIWRRMALLLGLLILLSAPVLAILAVQGKIPGLPGGLTARVTITPQSKLEADTYLLSALPTGIPDPAQRQIGARLLTQTSGTSTATGNATGATPATTATGWLTFQSVGGSGVTITPKILTGGDGVQVTFDTSLFVPTTGSPGVIGHAVAPGAAGNIHALDIDGQCCAPNIFVKNLNAFSGGRDAVPNSVIQQSDIDTAARPLIASLAQSASHALQTQVKANERVVNTRVLQCTPTIHPSVPAGTQARTVTVSVQVTCNEEVYDLAAARSMATALLSSRAQQDPALNAQYMLQGSVVTSVLSETVVTGNGQVSIEIQAQGLWVYQLTPQMQQRIKQSLVKQAKAQALSILLHEMGVATSTISLSSGELMPANASDITLIILALPGVRPLPTSTTSSSPTVLPTGPTPTPTNRLSGS